MKSVATLLRTFRKSMAGASGQKSALHSARVSALGVPQTYWLFGLGGGAANFMARDIFLHRYSKRESERTSLVPGVGKFVTLDSFFCQKGTRSQGLLSGFVFGPPL